MKKFVKFENHINIINKIFKKVALAISFSNSQNNISFKIY